MKGLGVRVVSGVLLLALVLVAIWLKGTLLMATVALATVLAAHEFYSITRSAGYRPWYPAGVALALVLSLRGYLSGDNPLTGSVYKGPPMGVEVLVLALVLVLAYARLGYIWSRTPALAPGARPAAIPVAPVRAGLAWPDLGLTVAGALYTGGLLGYAPLLASIEEGPGRAGGTAWLLLVLLGTAACDTGAYLVGNLLGRHKLIPHISPGKTWEGLAGAVLGSTLAAAVLSPFLFVGPFGMVVLGLLICAAAVTGDLCESLLKRAAGVKDSGHVIPGHGGILDRLDSILFVLLAVHWFTLVW